MDIFIKIFHALNTAQVKYMLAGGIAVNLYGVERATADVDIVILLDEKNILQFVSAVKTLGLKPKMPVKLEDFVNPEKRKEWIRTKGMKVFSLVDTKNPFFLIDVLTEISFDFDKTYRRRKKIKLEDTVIPLIPLDILIDMKEETGRPQDKADVFHLKKLMEAMANGR